MLLPWLFWMGSALVAYTYVGYGLLLYILVRLRGTPVASADDEFELPAVTLIVPAFNEEKLIGEKLENTLQLTYPAGRLTVIFVTDGSTDRTVDLLRSHPRLTGHDVRVEHKAERRGKLAAVERVMAMVQTPVVVFSDANTLLNREAIIRLVRPFAHKNVGAVAGEKRVAIQTGRGAQGVGEGLYWKYESFLKRLDAALYSTIGAVGELFAIRTSLYESVPPDTLIEDFHLSLRIAMRGYRVAYAPEAFAVEGYSATVREELKRKIRIAAGGWQVVGRLPALLNPVRYGCLSFQYISHRVLRWTLAPLLLPVLLVLNIVLASRFGGVYTATLTAQGLFYGMAVAGLILEQLGARIKLLYVPYYFCVMNYAVYAGALRLLRGAQSTVWEKAARA